MDREKQQQGIGRLADAEQRRARRMQFGIGLVVAVLFAIALFEVI